MAYTVVVDSVAAWGARSVEDFATFQAIILGDPTCIVGTGPIVAANENKAVWGPEITGNVVLVGTDLTYHSSFGPGGPEGGDAVTEKILRLPPTSW